MTGLAIALILTAAFMHAGWNFLAKRASGGTVFLWLFNAVSVVIYTPVALIVIVLNRPTLGLPEILYMAVSGALQMVYFLLLNWAYRIGDLSLVYPLARGSGPLIVAFGAVIFFQEQPTFLTIVGTISITLGIFVLTGDPRKLRDSTARPAIVAALLTGCCIAVYTLWDKNGVDAVGIPPLLYTWIDAIFASSFLGLYIRRDLRAAPQVWREHRIETLGVAIFGPLAYFLVLTALTFSPVSSIAPMREISTLIGAFIGVRVLGEAQSRRRFVAAAIMAIGVIALGLG